jgi:glycosyltransferase involved in cell wall biosynthesis
VSEPELAAIGGEQAADLPRSPGVVPSKICLLVHQYAYRHARVQLFAETLADAGAQVDLLCLRDPDQPDAGTLRGVRIFTIPVSRRIRDRGGHLLEYLVAFVLFTLQLMKLHARNRYQVIQIHNMPDFLAFAALIPKLFGAKLILDICDPMPEFYLSRSAGRANPEMHGATRLSREGARFRQIRLIEAQEKRSAAFVHALTCANTNFKECLVGRGVPAGKITVINYVPDGTLFDRRRYRSHTGGQLGSFTVLYPGTIAPRYGLEVAVRALPELKARIPGLRLMIMGPESEHGRELRSLAERLGVSQLLDIRPLVPLNGVAAQFAQADVGIYTALPDPHMSIAVPLKVLEYAAMGLPIVASRLKVLEDLFPESAIMFFEPGNVDQFTAHLFELYANPARGEEMVRNADELVLRQHPWSKERHTYFGLLNRLTESRRSLGEETA